MLNIKGVIYAFGDYESFYWQPNKKRWYSIPFLNSSGVSDIPLVYFQDNCFDLNTCHIWAQK